MRKYIIQLPLYCLLFGTLFGCVGKETYSDDAEGLYQQGEELFKDERYLLAIEKYRELKNRYPYSNRALDAELRIADAFFEQESYYEAESAYEIFKELHPTHPKAAYVQYKVAMSYYKQIPSNAARDLSAVHHALDAFEVLLRKFPSSEYAEDARTYQTNARMKLAEHEHYVADFYFKRKHYLSASYRYASLLKDFPKMGFDEEASFKLGFCFFQIQMMDNARTTLKKFLAEYPSSSYRPEAESILSKIGG